MIYKFSDKIIFKSVENEFFRSRRSKYYTIDRTFINRKSTRLQDIAASPGPTKRKLNTLFL